MTPPPDDGIPSMGYLVWSLSLRWQVQLSRELAHLGITHADYALLASLHGLVTAGARPSQRELADAGGLEPMYVSKLARSLEGRGLLRRDRHPDDPRAVQLSLTDAGTETVAAARTIVVRLDEARLQAVGGPAGPRATELRAALLTLLREARNPPPGP